MPDAPERSASLKGPDGLASRGKSGSAAVYTTANMAQRSDRTVLSKLKSLWKGGKTTANASLGPLAVGTQTQHPVVRHNQVQAPRFEADGRVPLPNTTKTELAQAVKEALHQLETGQGPGAEGSGRTGGVAGTAAYWAQQALSVLSLGKGPASVPSDALEMFYEAGGLKAGGQSSQGSATAETKSIVLGHLEGLVHAEKAKATIHLATQAALPDGARVNTEGALQQLTDAAKAAEQRSKDAATAANARMVAELLSGVPEPVQPRLQAATDTLVAALNHGTKVPDVLAVELLINTARDTFAGDPEGLATAMEDLSHSPPGRTGARRLAVLRPGQRNPRRAGAAVAPGVRDRRAVGRHAHAGQDDGPSRRRDPAGCPAGGHVGDAASAVDPAAGRPRGGRGPGGLGLDARCGGACGRAGPATAPPGARIRADGGAAHRVPLPAERVRNQGAGLQLRPRAPAAAAVQRRGARPDQPAQCAGGVGAAGALA
ncbi:hypothetical protein AVMA1855_02625 [Acidovorax sp. SUPP1855]|nr:hypothetical protein AVMA1855_02625 [Acidovorax sp. SUPP1855]